MRRVIVGLLVIVGIFASSGGGASANTLDVAFGDQGIATSNTDLAPLPFALATDRQGRILSAGSDADSEDTCQQAPCSYLIRRYSPGGVPDGSFGRKGIARLSSAGAPVGASSSFVRSIVSFPSGRIVIGGFRAGNGPRSSPFLVAYDQNGNLDRTFGKNGVVDPGLRRGGYRIHGIAAGGGGRIVTVGNLRETPGSGSPALVLRRYKASGKVDKSFGRNGSVVLKARRRQSYSSFDDVAVLKSGRIVAVGHKTGRLIAVRTNSRGRLDRSFSKDGRFSLRKNRNAGCDTPGCRVKASLATLSGGGLIIQGETLQLNAPILKLSKRGVLNRNFGTNGRVSIPFSEVGYPSEVAVAASGAIVLASHGVDSPGPKERTAFKVTQLHADGSRDTAFGTDGVLTLEPSASGGAATSAFPMRSGAVLVGGATTQPSGAPSLFATRLVKIAAR